MKKQLCITAFVFGKKYQEYIPFYIYSILRSYPDYYPLIFLDSKLLPSIREQLQFLSTIGDFNIVEEYFAEHIASGQKLRAMRWILDAPEFYNYEAVYITDIDMFILREDPSMFEQHWEHCSVLRLPYSNIIRKSTQKTLRLGNIGRRLRVSGLYSVFLSFLQPNMVIKKLSGLHFFKTDEYLRQVRPIFPKFKELIMKGNYQHIRATLHHSHGFNDESLLYDIVSESGLGLPPEGPYGPFMLNYKNYKSPYFRPHHGIHLGIFRTDTISEDSLTILQLEFYKWYYDEFIRMTENDPIFQRIMEQSSIDIKNIFSRIHQFYTMA